MAAVLVVAGVGPRLRGYDVLSAASGEEALILCQETRQHIDLMLVDVILPGINGVELADAVRRVRPAAKALFMSGYSDRQAVLDSQSQDGSEFMQKPFDSLALATRIRQMLETA